MLISRMLIDYLVFLSVYIKSLVTYRFSALPPANMRPQARYAVWYKICHDISSKYINHSVEIFFCISVHIFCYILLFSCYKMTCLTIYVFFLCYKTCNSFSCITLLNANGRCDDLYIAISFI